MQARRGIASRAMVVVVVLTTAGVLGFLLTHSLWYDCLDLGQKVSFWVEAAVAYGTLALAIVTWASVRESQDIVDGENLRFRLGRMPMVAVSKTYREHGGVFLRLRNSGDGPALNVRVSFDATTTLRWNDQGLAGAESFNKSETNDVTGNYELCSSFMPVGDMGQCEWLFGALAKDAPLMNAQSSITFRRLLISYEDTFGGEYITEHDSNVGGGIVPLRFLWKPPADLVSTPERLNTVTSGRSRAT